MNARYRLFIVPFVLALVLGVATPVFAGGGLAESQVARLAPSGDTTYVVQDGDSLHRIAKKFNVTVDALIAANHLTSTVLRTGQTLIIPGVGNDNAQPASTGAGGDTTYVVRSGDSLYRIAAKFNISVDRLIAANHLTSTVLHTGQTLIIPGAVQANANPGPSSVYDRIGGGASFVRRLKAALDWLQAHDPEAYARVNTYVTVINPSPYARLADAAPLPGGGCAVRALARSTQSLEMIAALLYHEASHCYQFATAGLLTTKEAEVFAYSEQIAFMERNGFPAEVLEYYRRVLDYYAGQPDDGRYIPPPNF